MPGRSWYRILALLLFTIEVLIATKFSHFQFVRWSLGDVLATILVYCAALSVRDLPRRRLALAVFLFACLLEAAQGLRLAQVLGLPRGSVLRIALGDSFSWSDIACYLAGTILAFSVDSVAIRRTDTSTRSVGH